MKISKIMMLFIAILLLVVSNDLMSQNKNKTGATLQHPYKFKYTLVRVDSCCFDLIIKNDTLGDTGHLFRVEVDDSIVVPYSEGFGYRNYGDKSEVTIRLCGNDELDRNTKKTFEIKIWCDHIAHLDPADLHVIQIPNCKPLPYSYTSNCCINYYIDWSIDQNDSLYYVLLDENDNPIEGYPIEKLGFLELPYDSVRSQYYIQICPERGGDQTKIKFQIYDKKHFQTSLKVTKELQTYCCNCETDDRFGPFTLTFLNNPNLCPNDSTCPVKIEYFDRVALPSWTNCYDTLKVHIQNQSTYEILNEGVYPLNSFNIEDLGILCIKKDQPYEMRMSFKSKAPSEYLNSHYNTCTQILLFDCTGIISDSVPSSHVGDPGPCTPDCDTSAWKGPEIKELIIYNLPGSGATANVTAEYYHRDGCDHQDIQITRFVFTTKNPELNSAQRTAIESVLFKKMTEEIIKENRMKFKPKDSDLPSDGTMLCDTTWRVTMGSCWAEVPYSLIPRPDYDDVVFKPEYSGSLGTSDIILFADPLLDAHFKEFPTDLYLVTTYKKRCENADCCLQNFKVCKQRNGSRIEQQITLLDSIENVVNCDNVFTIYDDWAAGYSYLVKCDSKCDWLTEIAPLIGDSISSKISFLNNNSDYIKYNINETIGKNEITLSMDFDSEAEVEILIFNISGQYIDSKKLTSTKGSNNITIKTNNYQTGVYFYTIIINNKMIKSNKFIITQ